jgi:uncharacterized protein (TIGR02996 family)
MSDREALLAAIQAVPADDAPRLVFADWLDENGDPDWAEFIRVQCQIDPFERSDSDLDRYRRAVIRKDASRPLPADFPPELQQYATWVAREEELLKANRDRWYGPMSRIDEDFESHLTVSFRRGFADEVGIAASLFHSAGDAIREACPVLRRLVLYGPREQLPELVALSALGGIPELELAGWITPYDARFLATFLASNPVTSLTLWIGSETDEEMIHTLATRPWDDDAEQPFDRAAVLAVGPYLGRLREVVLVQLNRDFTREADRLTADFNRTVGRRLARVERPFDRRFPLHQRVMDGLWAGNVDNSPALAILGDQGSLALFDSDGRWREVIDLVLERYLPSVPGQRQRRHEAWALDVVRRLRGFVPGTAFVREFEFSQDEDYLGVQLWGTYGSIVEEPDAQMEDAEYEEACATLHKYWMKGGNFVIRFGNDYWAGPDGQIHTT